MMLQILAATLTCVIDLIVSIPLLLVLLYGILSIFSLGLATVCCLGN